MPVTKAKPVDPKRILRASKRAQSYRAFEAGTVAVAHQAAAQLVKLLADAQAEADVPVQREISLLITCLKRFRDRVHTHLQAKTGALHVASQGVDNLERLLRRADHPGYGVAEMARRAQADANRVQALKASLQRRAQEMSFILAELEQLVDPVPGLTIRPASTRKKNAKLRAERVKALKKAPVAAPEGSGTSTLSYGVSAHAFYQNPQGDNRDQGPEGQGDNPFGSSSAADDRG